MRRGPSAAVLALIVLVPHATHAEEAASQPVEDPDLILSEDSWYLRLDAGFAYTREQATFHPTRDSSQKTSLDVSGLGPSIQLAIGARLGSDVTLGGLGRLVHSPVTQWEDGWQSKSQGIYYGEVFIDHRLPETVLRLGGGIGPGYLYTLGPEREGYGGIGPVATIWLGIDAPTSARVATGVTLDVTGAAIRQSHDVGGLRNDFSTFMLVVGISFSLRVSEPSWPKGMPTLARSTGTTRHSLSPQQY